MFGDIPLSSPQLAVTYTPFKVHDLRHQYFKRHEKELTFPLLQSSSSLIMSTASLFPPDRSNKAQPSPLPQLLQTPSGLALLELQGTINLPEDAEGTQLKEVEIGRLDFPDYTPGAEDSEWMKRVQLYIGQHQRLTGEVKKLPKAVAIVRRKGKKDEEGEEGEESNDLEVVEIVKYKLVFSNRPEPVGTENAP